MRPVGLIVIIHYSRKNARGFLAFFLVYGAFGCLGALLALTASAVLLFNFEDFSVVEVEEALVFGAAEL